MCLTLCRISTKKAKDIKAGLMIAKPSGSNPFDYYFHVKAEQLKQDKVISVFSPLVVENLLPGIPSLLSTLRSGCTDRFQWMQS